MQFHRLRLHQEGAQILLHANSDQYQYVNRLYPRARKQSHKSIRLAGGKDTVLLDDGSGYRGTDSGWRRTGCHEGGRERSDADDSDSDTDDVTCSESDADIDG